MEVIGKIVDKHKLDAKREVEDTILEDLESLFNKKKFDIKRKTAMVIQSNLSVWVFNSPTMVMSVSIVSNLLNYPWPLVDSSATKTTIIFINGSRIFIIYDGKTIGKIPLADPGYTGKVLDCVLKILADKA